MAIAKPESITNMVAKIAIKIEFLHFFSKEFII